MILTFTKKQQALLRELCPHIDASSEISEDEYFELEDAVADCLAMKGFEGDYQPTEIGILCESILDIISEA